MNANTLIHVASLLVLSAGVAASGALADDTAAPSASAARYFGRPFAQLPPVQLLQGHRAVELRIGDVSASIVGTSAEQAPGFCDDLSTPTALVVMDVDDASELVVARLVGRHAELRAIGRVDRVVSPLVRIADTCEFWAVDASGTLNRIHAGLQRIRAVAEVMPPLVDVAELSDSLPLLATKRGVVVSDVHGVLTHIGFDGEVLGAASVDARLMASTVRLARAGDDSFLAVSQKAKVWQIVVGTGIELAELDDYSAPAQTGLVPFVAGDAPRACFGAADGAIRCVAKTGAVTLNVASAAVVNMLVSDVLNEGQPQLLAFAANSEILVVKATGDAVTWQADARANGMVSVEQMDANAAPVLRVSKTAHAAALLAPGDGGPAVPAVPATSTDYAVLSDGVMHSQGLATALALPISTLHRNTPAAAPTKASVQAPSLVSLTDSRIGGSSCAHSGAGSVVVLTLLLMRTRFTRRAFAKR